MDMQAHLSSCRFLDRALLHAMAAAAGGGEGRCRRGRRGRGSVGRNAGTPPDQCC